MSGELRVRGLSHAFARDEVLAGIDFRVCAGEVLSLIHISEPTRPY